MPKPAMTPPIWRTISFLLKEYINTPISRNAGAISESLKAISWAVMVVPTFAPKMTPAA